jgi:threonylcarbamoyladenosine tRNA methylthiotransferase MtaB
MARTFFISNFGCRASQSEGASIHEELIQSHASESSSAFDADVVIVNSCTVTEEADRQVRQLIRRVAARNPGARVIVTGCYAQRAPEDLASLPGVRYVVGNSHKPAVGQLAVGMLQDDEDFSTHGRADILCSSIFLERRLEPAAHLGSGGRTRAVVKVQDGCNANCSFCIIPSVRGRSRSLPPERVLREVAELVSRGYKEIVFSGIHLGTYGRDLSPKTNFFDLLLRVLEIRRLERLRLSSIEPLEVTPEIIDLVAQNPRMAHHFHIPLQSGADSILRAMRRPYSAAYYANLLNGIRARVPDASIGADVMVGFPGETDADFIATYRLIEESPLTYLHVFPFSPRPGTLAAGMPFEVPEHATRHRGKALRELMAGKNEAFRRGMVGRVIEVLVLEDQPEHGWRPAISNNFIRAKVPGTMPENEWVRVRVIAPEADGVCCT